MDRQNYKRHKQSKYQEQHIADIARVVFNSKISYNIKRCNHTPFVSHINMIKT